MEETRKRKEHKNEKAKGAIRKRRKQEEYKGRQKRVTKKRE